MPLGHFARAVGLTTGRVSQLRSEGAIVGAQVGRGFEVDVVATLARCGRPDWVWVGEAVDAPAPVAAPPPPVAAPPPPADTPATPDTTAPADTTAGDYYTARARREVANASLAEIRLAEARRELRSASSVRSYCGEVGVAFRERMLAIESSAATRLDAADQVWLAAEIRRALSECADTLDRATERLLEGASLAPAGADVE